MDKRLKNIFLILTLFMLMGCFHPKPKMELIESDLNIEFPPEYSLIKNNEDWLGFDLTQEFTFLFDDKNSQFILSQIEKKEEWVQKDNIYYYEIIQMREDASDVISWSVSAEFDIENKILNYTFWDY